MNQKHGCRANPPCSSPGPSLQSRGGALLPRHQEGSNPGNDLPLRTAVKHFLPVVLTWPAHYQASDAVASTSHPALPPLQSTGQDVYSELPPALYRAAHPHHVACPVPLQDQEVLPLDLFPVDSPMMDPSPLFTALLLVMSSYPSVITLHPPSQL